MQQAKALIQEILDHVYKQPRRSERVVLAHFDRVKKETAPEIEELRAEIAKLRRMVVWAYPFSEDQLCNFDTEECEVIVGGGSLDSMEWAFNCVECDFDSKKPLDKDIFPW
jgi:hypothetical protein